MIYTVTFNPSLDYVVRMGDVKSGAVNRTVSEEIFEGGKGINVSIVLKNLGINSVALGFIAGFTGEEIERGVRKHGCITDFIRLRSGLSRINIKLKSTAETDINAQGPLIGEEDLEQLIGKLEQLKANDILVLSGSIPNTLPDNVYERILERLKEKGILSVVDATKGLLRRVLKYKPFLIKPNSYELEELFDKKVTNDGEILYYAGRLQEEGARNVLVSLAGDGAVLLAENGAVYRCRAQEGDVMNSVGAGDSMIAGFLAGYLKEYNYEYALRMGIAAGSASAFSTRLATKKEVDELYGRLMQEL